VKADDVVAEARPTSIEQLAPAGERAQQVP